MRTLREIRDEIDAIDSEMTALFVRRMRAAEEVAEVKRSAGSPVTNPAREREVLAGVARSVGPDLENEARLLFSTLMAMSRGRQRAEIAGEGDFAKRFAETCRQTDERALAFARVACPDAEGSVCQQAVSHLVQFPTILFFDTPRTAFEAVAKGMCECAVLPVENSAGGLDLAVWDEIANRAFRIVRTMRLRTHRATDGTDASARFACIVAKPAVFPDASRFALMMDLCHRPGALDDVLVKFAAIGVNLVQVVSRPIPGSDFTFRFILEFEASAHDEKTVRLLSALATDPDVENFRFLGAFSER